MTTIHATEHGRHQGWVADPPQSHIHSIERWMARRADAVIVCSYYMRGHVADIFDIDERRVRVIPNGVDPSELRPSGDLQALRGEFAAPEEKLVLLVGRLVYEKGFQLALDALPSVIERVGGLRFLVAGSGTHEAELKAQTKRLGLDEHGTFVGWIGDDVLHSLYRIADLCVVPSIYEPFGLVALEAMACVGLPVHRGGHGRTARGGARWRARGDCASMGATPSTWAVMIERLLVDEALRDRLVTRGIRESCSFDWDDIAGRTRGIYDELGRLTGARGSPEGMTEILNKA